MTTPSAEEEDSFKYSDLQNLAKRLGLRAALRADKSLESHLSPETRGKSKNQHESQSVFCSLLCWDRHINCEEQAEGNQLCHQNKKGAQDKSVKSLTSRTVLRKVTRLYHRIKRSRKARPRTTTRHRTTKSPRVTRPTGVQKARLCSDP